MMRSRAVLLFHLIKRMEFYTFYAVAVRSHIKIFGLYYFVGMIMLQLQ
jgi:hypothetical protein